MDRLRTLQAFVRVADHGSFHRAAVQLGISPQAVSKTIRQLEGELGVQLFHRTTRRTALTDEGAHFLEQVRGGLEVVQEAWNNARHSCTPESGVIRIAATGVVAKRMLVPLINEFRVDFPAVEFELIVADHYADLVAEGIDIGFRCGFSPETQVVVHELMRMQLFACASPAYLRRAGVPLSRDDLARHVCTGTRQPNTGRLEPWEFLVNGEIQFDDIPSPFCTNDAETELAAVLSGLGIGLLDSIIATDHLRAGRLVPVLCDTVSERFGLYLYFPQRMDMPRRVRAFIDFAVDKLRGSAQFHVEPAELRSLADAFTSSLTQT